VHAHLKAAADALLAVLLAPLCAGCGAPLERPTDGPVCEVCWLSSVNGIYEGSLRNIIHAFKYEGRRSLARRLAAMMRARSPEIFADVGATVPVPLHPSRRRSRGFNQAHDLARHLGLPVVHALRRTRATATQADLPAAERYGNVRGAFAPTGNAASLRGSVVLVVDDVMTTGATLESCARVLREGGVKEARVIAAARAVAG
jgi:ComF family protein